MAPAGLVASAVTVVGRPRVGGVFTTTSTEKLIALVPERPLMPTRP